MKILIIISMIFIFLVKGFESYTQNFNKIKSLKKLEKDSTVGFHRFDTAGNLVFSKYYEYPDRWVVSVNYYNSKNEIIKSISGHISLGYMIWEYEYDSIGNKIREYLYEDILDQKTRFFYGYIEDYSSAMNLETDSIIIKMGEKQRRNLFSGKSYNLQRQKLTDTTYKDSDSIAEIKYYKYDYKSNLLEINYKKHKGKFYNLYEYINNKSISLQIDEQGDTIQIHKYKYDKENHIIKDSSFSKRGENYSYTYLYKHGFLIKRLFYTSNGKLSIEDHYKYNAKGNILTQKTLDYRDNSIKLYKWKYEFY